MWKPFKSDESLYLISLEENEKKIKISVSDLAALWQIELTLDNLVRIFKEKNPSIEATPLIVKDNVLNLLENISKIKISVDIQGNQLNLKMEQSCSELTQEVVSQSIVYELLLQKKEQSEFKNKVTVAMIQTVHLLEEQQKLLLTIVKNKDRELQEYRMEKGEISRGDLKTEPFKTESLCMQNEKLFLDTFLESNCKEFWEKFKEDNGEIKITNLSVGSEPWNQIKKRKKVYNSKTVVKKGSGVSYASKK